MSLICGEGPLSLIICPSRELARQTHEILLSYSQKRLKEVLVRISIFNNLNILAEKKRITIRCFMYRGYKCSGGHEGTRF